MIIYKTNIRVRYAETDQMQYVYHGNYPQYLEIGRIEWLRNLGISYKKMEESGIMLPVFSLNINYLQSAKYDDELTITTILKEPPTVRIIFDYEIRNQKNELLTTASTTLVFINMRTNKPTRVPNYLLEKILEHF